MVNDKDLILMMPVWGRGIEQLERWALPSLLQPGNLPMLLAAGVKLHLQAFTLPGEQDWIEQVLRKIPFASSAIWASNDPALDMCHTAPKRAFEQGRKLFVCNMDQIWGNGSIFNLWNYAKGKPVVVAVPHLRVRQERWTCRFPISNRNLVDLALRRLHASQQAWSTEDVNTTYNSGVSLTRLSPTSVSLIHWLPAPWLCWFTERDVAFFSTATRPVLWDREWPSFILRADNWRVIGSSEIAFGVELSEEASTAALEEGRKHFEGYYERRPHHRTCGSFVCSLQH